MNHPIRCIGGLVLASLAFTALPASAGEISIGFDPGDAALVGPPRVELQTAVSVGGTAGTFTLTFDGQTTSASHFDGRLLTARDLTDEQAYRMGASSTFDTAYTFELYKGGVRVAAVDADRDGVAPFVLEGVDAAALAHRVDAAEDRHGEKHIEIHSWSLGSSWNATFDGGATLVVDHVVVHGHEVGHSLSIHYDIGRTSVHASGVTELRTGFAPPAGSLVRIRSARAGATFGTWSAYSSFATLVSRAPASGEATDDYEIEVYRAGTPTIGVHGYVKIKKLNSGG
jgi:hypothetical protein